MRRPVLQQLPGSLEAVQGLPAGSAYHEVPGELTFFRRLELAVHVSHPIVFPMLARHDTTPSLDSSQASVMPSPIKAVFTPLNP